jgi:hypothetical protein
VKFDRRKTPSRSAIKILLNKSATTGRMMDNNMDVVGVKKSVVTPEYIHHFEQAITQGLGKSVKHLSQQLNLGASPAYSIRIIREYVKLLPYRIQTQQAHPEAEKARRFDFCDDIKMYIDDTRAVNGSKGVRGSFSFERVRSIIGIYGLVGNQVAKQRHHYTQQGTRCGVLCQQAVLLEPFFDDTATAECYLDVLQADFFHFSQQWLTISRKRFSKGTGLGNTVNEVLDVLNEHCDDRELSNRGPQRYDMVWPQ